MVHDILGVRDSSHEAEVKLYLLLDQFYQCQSVSILERVEAPLTQLIWVFSGRGVI